LIGWRRTELVGFTDESERVVAELRHADGGDETVEAAYVAGCGDARSLVRETIGTGFPGGTYHQLFYVADVAASGAPIDGELHVDLDEADFLAIFPLTGKGQARLVGTVRDERAERGDQLRFEDVYDRAIKNLKVTIDKTHWFSTYHVHHRVAQQFRKGRAFLFSDAAHIHSPAGGQGMNTGIGDAIDRVPWVVVDGLDDHRRSRPGRRMCTVRRALMLSSGVQIKSCRLRPSRGRRRLD
jgi:2-polyprenyl-6-methoxyphenol hydroxylase-like FAD-dependent oxidoreductase